MAAYAGELETITSTEYREPIVNSVATPPSPQDRAKALLVHPRVGDLTPKEIGFLESLTVWRGQPTPKQLDWLRRLEKNPIFR